MALHSSAPAWKIPWTEEPVRLQSMGSLTVGHDWASSLSLFTFMHWRRKWQPTPVFLPGESQGRGSLVGCHLWGRHRVGHDWSDLAAAAVTITAFWERGYNYNFGLGKKEAFKAAKLARTEEKSSSFWTHVCRKLYLPNHLKMILPQKLINLYILKIKLGGFIWWQES